MGALTACGSDDTGSGNADPDAGGSADATDDTRERPSLDTGTPEVVEDTGTPDVGVDTAPDTAPDTEVPDVGIDTPPQPDTGGPQRCGNGVREQGEVCDGDDILPGATCERQGFIGGELGCTDTCVFDVTACYDELCGDGLISGTEDCDGADLNDATCASLGFAPGGAGSVTCVDCMYDTSTCEDSICGNDNVEIDFEACDGEAFGDVSCRSLGFFTGGLSCNDDCSAYDDSGCVTNICGNGTIEGPETCDGGFATVTCRDLEFAPGENYAGGLIGCSDDCIELDTSGCIETAEELGDDADDDGIADIDDNCVDDPNPRQLDADGDGVGNVCDEAVVWDVLVGETSLTVTASAGFDLGGGGLPLPIPLPTDISSPMVLPVSAASIGVAFDDDGLATIVALDIELGAASVPLEFDLSGLGIPVPDIIIEVAGGQLVNAVDNDGFIAVDGTFEDYVAGLIEGNNGPWNFYFDLSIATGGSVSDLLSRVTTSSSSINLYDDVASITFDDLDVPLGTAEITINLELLPGFPFPLPIGVDFTGLDGTVAVTTD